MSRTSSGRNATASRTACGPSARNSPVRERTERRDSARTDLTRSDRGLVSTGRPGARGACVAGRRRSGGVAGDLRLCLRRDVGAGELHQGGEGGSVVDGEVREDLAVDLDTSGLEALHEPVVRHAVGAGRGIDALDPEATEVALLGATVTVGIDQRVGDLLLGLAVQTRPLPAVTAGALENDATLLMGVDRPLHACHVNTPSLLDAVLAAAGLPGTRLLSEVLMGGGPAHLPRSFLAFLASGLASSTSFAMERIFLLDLCSSRWRPPACSRMTLPVPVRRKRFFAPLCVFIFGMGADLLRVARVSGRTWCVGPGARASSRSLPADHSAAAMAWSGCGVCGCSAAAAGCWAGRCSCSCCSRDRRCSALASAFFLVGPITMIMLRPSCFGADSTKPSSAMSSARRSSRRRPSSGRLCSRPRNMIVTLTLSPALRNRSTWPFLVP